MTKSPHQEPPDEQPELDNKFRVILVSAQRARQLQKGANPRIDIDAQKHKPIRIALEEVISGKVPFRERKLSEERPPQKLAPDHEYVALALIGDKIKLVSLSPDGQYKFLDERNDPYDFFHVSPVVAHLEQAIDELEWLVNNPKAREEEFQAFFKKNKDFILNDEYKDAHSHIVFTSENGPLVPDFVLEPIEQGALCDLLELKLPAARLFTLKKNRMRYSAAVAEACAQLREYGRFFEEERNRKSVLELYGLRAYKPKMFVIIGRHSNIDPLDARNIQTDLPNLHLRTYDDIINRMKWRAENMKKGDSRFDSHKGKE